MRSADVLRREGTAVRHVLMTADAVGGVWTYALDLACELGRDGVRVSLAVLGPPPSAAQRASAAALGNVDLHEHAGRLEWMADPWDDVAAAGRWLLRLERQVRPDVVHLNGYCHASLPWNVPVLVAGHSCVLSWWVAVHGEDAPAAYASYADRVGRGLHAADAVVTPTGAMLRALEHHYGRLARGRVVFNGRRPASFPPKAVMSVAPADVTAGATAGATAGTAAAVTAVTADAIAAAISGDTAALKQPFVLCAGRLWDEAKNVAALCAIAPALSWPVYVAGEVSDPSGHHLAPAPPAGVRYLGPLGEHTLAAWMAQASIYALPARYEPFGLSVLEAAQAGCALVLGDIASLREVWGDAAVYVPPDDREALRYELAALIDDGRRRGVLAERSRRRAGTLTVERMAAGYTDTYREIADEVRSVLPLRAV